MIYRGDKQVNFIHYGDKVISHVYKGAALVWQAVRSCFGSGSWMDDKSWLDSESWKDN